MDFVDWRKKKEQQDIPDIEEVQPRASRYGRRVADHVEEMIRDAQQRGDFDNLQGEGKPFQFEKQPDTGDNAMAYCLLKDNDYLPPEVELAKQIDREIARINAPVDRLRHEYQTLLRRKFALYDREKRAFNATLEKTLAKYDEALRGVNSKILTLNITAPVSMHRSLLKVDALVQQLRSDCPPFAL